MLAFSQNIYSQQFQTAKFLKKYYSDKPVAVNDLGYPAYYSDAKIIDIEGLGNTQIALAKKNHLNLNKTIHKEILRNDVKIVCIYKDWFEPSIYKYWIKNGDWKLKNQKKILVGPVVSIFCISNNKEDIDYLKKYLAEFNQKELTKYSDFIWYK